MEDLRTNLLKVYVLLEYIKEISNTVGSILEINSLEYSDNSDEDDESTQEETKENSNSCVVCLRAR